jgi:probable HAF family extracellular repeat protein
MAVFSLMSALSAQAATIPLATIPPGTPRYTMIGLDPTEQLTGTVPVAVNSRGQVTGYIISSGVDTPFLYSNGQMTRIAVTGLNTHPIAMNDLGDVVGVVYDDDLPALEGFLYTNGQTVILYPSVSAASAINDYGEIVGQTSNLSVYSPNSEVLFSYTAGKVIFQAVRGSATPGNPESSRFAINNREEIVGPGLAYLYSGGKLKDLGPLSISATAINELDQIVGSAGVTLSSVNAIHAFLYSGGRMQDLGTLGGTNSYALGINDLGVIVGAACPTGSSSLIWPEGTDTAAFIYILGQMFDLNKLLIASPAGWKLIEAVGINDAGQIAVIGLSPIDGTPHSFLLNPVYPVIGK